MWGKSQPQVLLIRFYECQQVCVGYQLTQDSAMTEIPRSLTGWWAGTDEINVLHLLSKMNSQLLEENVMNLPLFEVWAV